MTRPRGLTLIELLVVVTIIGVLAALLLSGVQAARQASRRAQCLSNLRQIGLALHSYHASANCLPPGRIKVYDPRYRGDNPPCSAELIDKSLQVHILPYLEQVPLYNAVNHDLSIFGRENTTVWSVSVAAYACPSDPGAGTVLRISPRDLIYFPVPDPSPGGGEAIRTSYVGCYGSLDTFGLPIERLRCQVTGAMIAQNNGCFHDVSPVRFASVTDGLAQTIAVSERATDAVGAIDRGYPGPRNSNQIGWWVTGNQEDTLFTGLYPPNAFDSIPGQSGLRAGATSYHPGGVNALMCDGSARFIKETIESWSIGPAGDRPAGARRRRGAWTNLPTPGVWQNLCTRNGAEVSEGF